MGTDLYRKLVEESSDIATIIDSEGTITYVSPSVEDTLGYEPEELLGESGFKFQPAENSEAVSEAIAALHENPDEPQVIETRFRRADGSLCWIESTLQNRMDDPDIDGILVNSRDISGRKEQERQYQELAEEYEALLETSGDAIFLLDVDSADDDPTFEFARLSPGYEVQTGLTTEAVRGQTPTEVFGDERGAELRANYHCCVEQRAPISYREELDIADDARFWDTSLAPVIVNGEIVRIVGIARNVTEQVERERELEATNQRLKSLIEAAPLTIMEIDSDGNVVLWNEGAEEMFGWSQEEVLGEFNPIVPENQRTEFETHRQRALRGERIRGKEIQRETKDGERLDLLLSVAPLTDADGTVTSVLAVLEEITEQKRLENDLRALQETAQELSRAESTADIGTIAIGVAEETLGFEIAGLWKHDERGGELIPIVETAAARELFGESPQFTSGNSLAWEAFQSGELHVYGDLQAQQGLHNPETELRSEILIPLGEYGLLSASSPSRQEFSETDIDLFRILGATVEAALARVSREESLQRQNERLDQFASVVAHDLRNPLTVASGFLELVEETGELEHLDRIESAHSRMERLIQDLLTLARGETTVENPERIDLETVATEAWGYVDTDEATLSVRDTVPTVSGEEERLTQLFENLFRNAVEHGGNDVTVTVGRLDGTDGFYVEDDGDGIPPEKRADVFEHGVTSSEGGTGFGLSIVADIAKAHGWTASVTDGTHGGARFEFETAG
ncbi:MAG: PAS domain S-box-containing protein [Natronomonas sp.]|jgi:PAS domain S-box-containing protein